jgi:hypothetical protein
MESQTSTRDGFVKCDVYCTRCSSWHEAEVDEGQYAAQSIDGNPLFELCPRCQREADIEFDMKYPHIGCCGSKDGK